MDLAEADNREAQRRAKYGLENSERRWDCQVGSRREGRVDVQWEEVEVTTDPSGEVDDEAEVEVADTRGTEAAGEEGGEEEEEAVEPSLSCLLFFTSRPLSSAFPSAVDTSSPSSRFRFNSEVEEEDDGVAVVDRAAEEEEATSTVEVVVVVEEEKEEEVLAVSFLGVDTFVKNESMERADIEAEEAKGGKVAANVWNKDRWMGDQAQVERHNRRGR